MAVAGTDDAVMPREELTMDEALLDEIGHDSQSSLEGDVIQELVAEVKLLRRTVSTFVTKWGNVDRQPDFTALRSVLDR